MTEARMTAPKEATDYLCLAFSPKGYICNEKPHSEGEHVAWTGFGQDRHVVDRWHA